jgi:oxalate decarboxylase
VSLLDHPVRACCLIRYSHYIENTSDTEDLVWIEIYKSDRVADIPLTQWLALTPADIVAQTLKVPISFVEKLKKEKQVLIS